MAPCALGARTFPSMTRHVVLSAFLLLSSVSTVACTQETGADDENTESSADELRVKQLRDWSRSANIVESHPDGTARVLYAPQAYEGDSPYWEALAFETDHGTPVEVSVE